MSTLHKVVRGLGSYIIIRRLRERAFIHNIDVYAYKIAWFPWGSTYCVKLSRSLTKTATVDELLEVWDAANNP